MGGNVFKPDVQSVSGLSGAQQQIMQLLANVFAGTLSGIPEGAGGQLAQNLFNLPEVNPDDVFQGFLAPSLRAFDQDIAPRIKEGFAQGGASFSSRRGDALARTLEGLQTSALSSIFRPAALRNSSSLRNSIS